MAAAAATVVAAAMAAVVVAVVDSRWVSALRAGRELLPSWVFSFGLEF